MLKIAIVGCTGKLGSAVMKKAFASTDIEVCYAIARKGNQFVGKKVSELMGGKSELMIIDDIESADDCDVYIDCTNAETFMNSSYSKYEKMKKPLVIATTAFSREDVKKINELATNIPIFMTGNFSVALHDFIETIKYYARKISLDTDIQIVEYHHNQKKDAPSGTALMIKEALLEANSTINRDKVTICSIRGGNIFGKHEVIFANCKDEVVTFKHQVSSREPFADGALEVSKWIIARTSGLYNMDDFCSV
ncbi:MAG: 4-hydroxy-tetrahydrodipicolinate reductase [Lachnospiraceae bacterium]|nr:4-hydroxy-tetrahydrodipicolinate reductase [Lachnospiraceae bacterium]